MMLCVAHDLLLMYQAVLVPEPTVKPTAGWRACRAGQTILAQYDSTCSNNAMVPVYPNDPSTTALQSWYSPGFPLWETSPGVYTAFADNATVTYDKKGTTYTSNPFK